MSFPDREQRTKCWTARDDYWKCLDEHAPQHNSTSGEKVPSACQKFRKLFESNCSMQWVKHFDRKRTFEHFKERMNKGYDPLDERSQSRQQQ